jgi:hypothetical protein
MEEYSRFAQLAHPTPTLNHHGGRAHARRKTLIYQKSAPILILYLKSIRRPADHNICSMSAFSKSGRSNCSKTTDMKSRFRPKAVSQGNAQNELE